MRRRDITDLFLGTGVGARGYAVIEQGMISRIIEARPEELRAYIEEAAGVSKYKERRKETEGRLKDTREHLQRLGDLQNELARQVEKLEKQAETAERYKSLTAQLNRQQDLLDYAQWQQSLAAADKATEQHQSLQAQQDETAAQVQALNDEVHALQTAEQSQQQAVHELSNKRGVLREQIARLEEQIRHQQNLHQRIERDKQAAQAQLQRIHQEQQQIRVQLEENELYVEEKQTELAEWAMQVAEHEERLPELEETQTALNAAFQTQQDEANRIRRELALKQQQLAHAEQTVAKHEERKGRLKQENQALNLPDEAETAAAQEAAALLQSRQEHYEEQIIAAEEALHAAREAFQTASNRFQSLKQQHITLQAQQQALSQILSQQQEAADFLAGNRPRRRAAAVATHHRACRVAARLVRHPCRTPARPRRAARFRTARTFAAGAGGVAFRRSLRRHQKIPARTGIAEPNPSAAAVSDGIALLARRRIVRARFELCPRASKRFGRTPNRLTPEGHQVDKVSVLLYAKPAQESLIAQKARLDGIASELENLAPELSAAEAAFKQAEAAVRSSEVQHKNLMQQQQQHTRQYSQAQQRAAELLARTNQGQIRREHIARELAQLAEEQTVLQHTSDGLSDDIATLQEAAAELEHQQQTTAHSRQEQQGRLKQAQLALLEANRQYGLAEVAVHKLNQQKQNYQQQIAQLEQQTLDWQERQQELALAYETEFQNDEQHIKLDELTEAVQTLDEEYIAVQEKLAQIQAQGREQYARVQTLQTQLPQLQAATQTALLQQQEALINAKRYHQNLTERAADLDALEALAKESPKVLNSSIGSLSQQIEALGAVNLAALQELEEARERDGYYRSQSEDVQAAITILEEAIAQIDDKTKARFKETFDAVNGKVQTFFPTLFGGGEATLKMIGDDLLTAGVSIMARPPGKKNSTIHLLSGGEKALTAMSLVFALFSLNPAPFCLLDEVDAPLDDANTSRFCNLVKEMSAQTQFLYISHNRLTMEMAEQLVGVTMQEKGVSRVVAVDIKQALEMAEAV
ncbi:chromosome segregation protein SMC [Neisseria meningitidis]